MTYAALLEAYGWERFATDAAAAGATSMIVSDVPAGQRPELRARPPRRPHVDGRADPPRRVVDRRVALPRHPDGHDGRPRRAVLLARGPRRANAPAGGRRAALRGLRHLDARARGRGRVAGRRRRRRAPVRCRSRRTARRRSGRTSRRCGTRSTLRLVDADALPAPRAAGATLREEEALRLGDLVPQDPAEVRLQGPGPTRTSIFPRFAPSSSPMNASGARSMPSTIVSR